MLEATQTWWNKNSKFNFKKSSETAKSRTPISAKKSTTQLSRQDSYNVPNLILRFSVSSTKGIIMTVLKVFGLVLLMSYPNKTREEKGSKTGQWALSEHHCKTYKKNQLKVWRYIRTLKIWIYKKGASCLVIPTEISSSRSKTRVCHIWTGRIMLIHG